MNNFKEIYEIRNYCISSKQKRCYNELLKTFAISDLINRKENKLYENKTDNIEDILKLINESFSSSIKIMDSTKSLIDSSLKGSDLVSIVNSSIRQIKSIIRQIVRESRKLDRRNIQNVRSQLSKITKGADKIFSQGISKAKKLGDSNASNKLNENKNKFDEDIKSIQEKFAKYLEKLK